MLQVNRQSVPKRASLIEEFQVSASDNVSPFRDLSDEQIAALFVKPLYQEVIGSQAFQRLKEIHFLGAIDYVIHTGGPRSTHRHTRFQHSLRVSQLALHFAQLSELSESEERLLVVSALLHDIGHAPLSHSLEPTFKERFGLTHHTASEMIIEGKVPLGHGLLKILQTHKILPKAVLALIDGQSLERSVEAFRRPINIDTIEAITRSYTYLVKTFSTTTPMRIVQALVRRNKADVQVLDEFWQLKDTVYNRLITSEAGLLADYICQKYMEENFNMWEGIYFHSEAALRKKHPKLFLALRELKTNSVHSTPRQGIKLSYQRRQFTIDPSVRLTSYKELQLRYRQTRSSEVVVFR